MADKLERSRRRRMRVKLLGALLLIGLGALTIWQRPWADSRLTAVVSVSTDQDGVVAERTVRRLFSARSRDPSTHTLELDLGQWAGELVCLDVRGSVGLRAVNEGDTGYVACAAEVIDESGTRPLEFVGWQEGGELGLHTGPVGPRAMDVGESGGRRYASAISETLWYVWRVTPETRVRLFLRPVLARALPGRFEPFVPRDLRGEARPLPQAVGVREGSPDVFIYLIDALRGDHLGCYGYGRNTSPSIDAFAADSTLYEQAHTAATWTRPSVGTLLSGLYPSVHGAVHTCDGLAEWPVLLPELLRSAGYATRCITANLSVNARFGFDQGYDEFIYLRFASAAWVNMMAEKRLRAEDREQPVFMFLHIMEPHGPYTPRRESFRLFDRGSKGRRDGSTAALNELSYIYPDLSDEDIEHLLDLYDAEVYEADQAFAEFVETLKRHGRYEDSVVVLVSDHGEAFAEHDTRAHGFDLNQETMRVPLMVKFPGGEHAGARVKHEVSLADVLPTVLAAVGLRPELPYALPGRDVRPAGMPAGPGSGRRIHAEIARLDSNAVDLVGVIDEDGYKRVVDVSVLPRETAARKSLGLWDTRADPREQNDLTEELPVRAAYGEQLIARWLVSQGRWRDGLAPGPSPKVELPAEVRGDLRALGYLRGAKGEREREE